MPDMQIVLVDQDRQQKLIDKNDPQNLVRRLSMTTSMSLTRRSPSLWRTHLRSGFSPYPKFFSTNNTVVPLSHTVLCVAAFAEMGTRWFSRNPASLGRLQNAAAGGSP